MKPLQLHIIIMGNAPHRKMRGFYCSCMGIFRLFPASRHAPVHFMAGGEGFARDCGSGKHYLKSLPQTMTMKGELLSMYCNINEVIRKELANITDICNAIELKGIHILKGQNGKLLKSNNAELLRQRNTEEGIIYDKRWMHNGKWNSMKLGGENDPEVIRIKQKVFESELLYALKKDKKLLEKIAEKFIPYDPDSIDARLKPLYRDGTGLVNKAPGIVSADEWISINNKRNSYQLPDDSNVTTDGKKARSKSDISVKWLQAE